MLEALLNFALVDVVVIVIAVVIGGYALIRVRTRVVETSAELDAHTEAQLAAIDRERAAKHHDMDIHSRA
jgi:hypothetical protein